MAWQPAPALIRSLAARASTRCWRGTSCQRKPAGVAVSAPLQAGIAALTSPGLTLLPPRTQAGARAPLRPERRASVARDRSAAGRRDGYHRARGERSRPSGGNAGPTGRPGQTATSLRARVGVQPPPEAVGGNRWSAAPVRVHVRGNANHQAHQGNDVGHDNTRNVRTIATDRPG